MTIAYPAIYLDDYLREPEFQKALSRLAADFRKTVHLEGEVNELGLVCPDVFEAVTYLQKKYKNIGQFMIGEGPPKRFIQDGKLVEYTTRVAFGVYQGVILEIAEPGEGSDLFATHLDESGRRITIHHMGFIVKRPSLNMRGRKYLPIMVQAGYAPWTEADIVLVGANSSITIFKTFDKTGGISLEFIRFRIFGLEVPFLLKPGIRLIAWIQKLFKIRMIRVS
jgi:hypothetical protein